MSGLLFTLWRDVLAIVPLIVGTGLTAFIWLEAFITIRPTTAVVFLHRSILSGVTLTGEWWQLFFVPLAATMLWLTEVILSFVFHAHNKTLIRLLLTVGCGALLGWWWGFHRILLINY